jgi:hypothetical protein
MCERLLSYVQANHLVNWIGAKTFRQHICSPRYLDWCSIDRSASMEPLLQGALHQVNVGTCVAHLPKEKPCPGSEDRTVLSVYHNMRRVADAKIVHRECEQSSWWKHVRQALPRRRRRMWVLRAQFCCLLKKGGKETHTFGLSASYTPGCGQMSSWEESDRKEGGQWRVKEGGREGGGGGKVGGGV